MLFWLLATVTAPQVTLASLIDDATSLDTLCEFPEPFYVTRQWSSYDRSSVRPGNEAWFANQDWGNFVAHEERNGHKEHVLAKVEGPGAMVRYWSPNPAGVTRIYIDGSETPALEARTADLLGGKIEPFASPVGQETAKGWTLYAPVPFQKSLKVTVDDSDNDAGGKMYYQVQCRQFGAGVTVEPFSIAELKRADLAKRMAARPSLPLMSGDQWVAKRVEKGGSLSLSLSGTGKVATFLVGLPAEKEEKAWTDPSRHHNLLRAIRVVGEFDGEKCIDAPLGDLMGTPLGLRALKSMPLLVDRSGVLALQFPMPYKSSAKFSLVNDGGIAADLRMAALTQPYDWTNRSMHFKAQWKGFTGSSRPMADLPFLDARGSGVFVGCNAGISNPVPAWWGEGDEKMYVDGEDFPSTFGTGTEDYFGYGWCDPTLFEHPFHFQTRCDGPGNKGHTSVGRLQVIDRLPFEKSFRFDMELWHWAECNLTYGRTAYWYAKPGGSAPSSDPGKNFLPPFIEGATRVKGAVEGEEAQILESNGGVVEQQGFGELSNGKQLWWRNAAQGDKLSLKVGLPEPGRYRVFGRFCFARDYGVQRIQFGEIDKSVDFFGQLTWKTVDLGVTRITGDEKLNVQVLEPNAQAVAGNMFGLDYLLFVKD